MTCIDRQTERQMEGSGFCCSSGGCCQIYEFALAKHVFVNCKCMYVGRSVFIDVEEEVHRDKG